MKIELYHTDHSTCSQKVRLCLAEKQLSFTSHQISLANGEHLTEEYLAINPNGVVPALVHNGDIIVESSVICEYIDEVFPTPSLSPQSALGRANMREWLRYIDEVPSMAIRVPSFQNVLLPMYQEMSESDFENFVQRMPVRKQFFQRMGQDGFSDPEYGASIEQLEATIERMERCLEKSQWLVESSFSIADICVIPVFQRMVDIGMSALWQADHPKVTDWFERARLRSSFNVAFYPGSRLSDAFPELQRFANLEP